MARTAEAGEWGPFTLCSMGSCGHVAALPHGSGNYRGAIFRSDNTTAAFPKCLSEACEKSGRGLLPWCIMSNHDHLAVETPQGCLVAAMQWLQGTFATRFNRLRRPNGHRFLSP
ncbi:MAG: hypothetical protein D6781_13355 [Verrucomicrobia bacterium]|nr:MAG: hypothetical protein D6781_13355 [Verrucomicrobiota bacterium]